MAVFTITTNTSSAPGKPFYFPFECDVASVDEFCERLSRGELIPGDRLICTDDGRGGLLIKSRERFGIGAGQAGIGQDCKKRVWEPQD